METNTSGFFLFFLSMDYQSWGNFLILLEVLPLPITHRPKGFKKRFFYLLLSLAEVLMCADSCHNVVSLIRMIFFHLFYVARNNNGAEINIFVHNFFLLLFPSLVFVTSTIDTDDDGEKLVIFGLERAPNFIITQL